jgi:hypothetical protein
MIAAPCSPRLKAGEPAMCARAVSQRVALRCAGGSSAAPDLRPGGWLAFCFDCAGEISLLAGNTRAVRQEWEITP